MGRRRLDTADAATGDGTSVSSSPGNDVSPSIMITALVLAIVVILAASLYLLLRFLRRHRNHSPSLSSTSPTYLHQTNSRRVSPANKDPLIDSLPLFTYDSLSSSATAGDCAVCLSKFHRKDILRLLPICCHAFHAECIDTWLSSNQSCPLCRSPVFLPESEILGKFSLLQEDDSLSSSRSFPVEIGNVSQRTPHDSGEITDRSYSLGGSFVYVVDDSVSEVPVGSFRRNSTSEFKVDSTAPPDAGTLAAEVGPRGGWLKEYLSSSLSSSRTTSFRGSGRWFFTGSSRRSTAAEVDMEASQLSEDIGELFRWLSGM